MLICCMYHNINADKYSNDLSVFESHLSYIKKRFTVVWPGDDLTGKDVCLTFDDGYYNFYEYVYPLLKKYEMKALLAVPTKYILEKTDIDKEKRLSVLHDDACSQVWNAPFCTFEELKEMSESGYVKIVSHSHSHANLTECKNLIEELLLPKKIIEKKIGTPCDIFVLPYGRYNLEVLKQASKIYKYIFRVGNGVNRDFNGIRGLIYRIDADGLRNAKEIFSFPRMVKYRLKYIVKLFLKSIQIYFQDK